MYESAAVDGDAEHAEASRRAFARLPAKGRAKDGSAVAPGDISTAKRTARAYESATVAPIVAAGEHALGSRAHVRYGDEYSSICSAHLGIEPRRVHKRKNIGRVVLAP